MLRPIAPRRDLQQLAETPVEHARGQPVDAAARAGSRVVDVQPRHAGLVGRVGDEALVGGESDIGHVPFRRGDHRREFARAGIEFAEALEIRSLVRDRPDRFSVGRVVRVGVGDVFLLAGDRAQLAALQVDLDNDRMRYRHAIHRERLVAVGREIADVPTAAADLRDKAVGGRIARIDHVQIHVGAVAPARRVADRFAVAAPRAEPVARLAVGEQGQLPGIEPIELVELVAALVFLHDQGAVFRRKTGVRHGLGLEADLPPSRAGRTQADQLLGAAEARLREHGTVGRIPAEELGGAEFQIAPCRRGRGLRYRRHLIGDDRRRRRHRRRCRGERRDRDQCREQRGGRWSVHVDLLAPQNL